MIQLKLAGEQLMISPSGVSFLKGREDRYLYLPSAFKLYKLLFENEHWKGHHLELDYPPHMPTDEDMLNTIIGDNKSLYQTIEQKQDLYSRHIDIEVDNVMENTALELKDREAFANNLRVMKPYRLQRNLNKILYHMLIEKIAGVVYHKNIERIEVPPTRNFLHVLQSMKSRRTVPSWL